MMIVHFSLQEVTGNSYHILATGTEISDNALPYEVVEMNLTAIAKLQWNRKSSSKWLPNAPNTHLKKQKEWLEYPHTSIARPKTKWLELHPQPRDKRTGGLPGFASGWLWSRMAADANDMQTKNPRDKQWIRPWLSYFRCLTWYQIPTNPENIFPEDGPLPLPPGGLVASRSLAELWVLQTDQKPPEGCFLPCWNLDSHGLNHLQRSQSQTWSSFVLTQCVLRHST